ncbi:uncharacterized protein LOC129565768 [Sitodiplosis mosellana]|uniref:uncharacterized protein LOC129565768 n=1 Tax=Sitodiplosis mosellana TaxID=263140 RepID=UPI0024443D45|nr:uncharacterized protein LOC129565768 [Sitodiplosis mosellana]
MKKNIFREDVDFVLDVEQEAIERGSYDFLREENCVEVIAPLFRRFLSSFQESIIPNKIADVMRFTTKSLVDAKLRIVIDELNELPIENKHIINEVLKIAKAIYDKRAQKNWKDQVALLRIVDSCFTRVDHLTKAQIKSIQTINYPMLARFIENWGVNIYFDEFNHRGVRRMVLVCTNLF